jgi:membrane protein implicated in regulation of membrane protease activity
MQATNLHVVWFIAGIVLMVLELVVPGGIVFFIGLGAVAIAALLFFGVLEGWMQAMTGWFVVSLFLIFALRGFAQRVIPAEVARGSTDEDLDAYDQIAVVAVRIPAEGEGRINFKGTTWKARNYRQDVDLEPGTRVRIIYRDNISWMVEMQETEEADT